MPAKNGEINIVIAKPFQNRHIGRRVINEIIRLAKESGIKELYAEIYDFNTQSQKMFESVGFKKPAAKNTRYLYKPPLRAAYFRIKSLPQKFGEMHFFNSN